MVADLVNTELQKLSNSITVTDDIFLKAFFTKAFSVDELQGKTKKLLKGGTETCAEIFESIHSDYHALKTVELMKDTTDPSSNFLSSRRIPKDDNPAKKGSISPHAMRNLSYNVVNLLPRT